MPTTNTIPVEMLGSQDGENEDDSLLGDIRAIIELMLEAVHTSETSVYFHETTREISQKGLFFFIMVEYRVRELL
jgi:hypothetical protein